MKYWKAYAIALSGVILLGAATTVPSQIWYTAVGGIRRLLASKLADIVSAADYCAVIDGVTDNRTCIQNAVNAGRSVYFPPSNFVVTGPIYLSTTGQQLYANGTKITASGATTTIFLIGTTNGSTFTKTDKVTIDGFDLVGAADGTGSPGTTPVGISIMQPTDNPYVDGNGCSGVVITNNNITGFLAGVAATAADRLTIQNNRLSGMKYYAGLAAGGYGILLQTVFHPKILGNKFIATSTDRHAMYISSDPGRTLDNNNVCKDVIIEGNAVDWRAVNGVGPTQFEVAIAVRAPENLEFTGNTVLGGYGGIDYDLVNANGKMTNISGNILGQQVGGSSERAAINYLRSSGSYTGTGLTITGNTIDLPSTGTNTHGISLSFVTEVQVSGNLIRNNGISNINIGTNTTHLIISGNTLECNTSYCYRFSGTGVDSIDIAKNRNFNNGGALFTFINQPTNFTNYNDSRITLTYGATVNTDASLGNMFVVTATNGTAFTVANPTNLTSNQRVMYTIRNGSGGALGAITWGATFKINATAIAPANATGRSVAFVYDGTNLVELWRGAADVPN